MLVAQTNSKERKTFNLEFLWKKKLIAQKIQMIFRCWKQTTRLVYGGFRWNFRSNTRFV